MSRIARSLIAVVSGLALVLGLVSGATAQSKGVRHSGTKIVKPIQKPASSAAKKAAAKKAAEKKAAAKKAAEKKAAAKKAAAKKAAAKKAAAKRVAAKKAAESRKQAARKTLLDNILNSVTPDVPADLPTDMPTADPSQTDPAAGGSGAESSMPILCPVVYSHGPIARKPHCGWYGPIHEKPTAAQVAFNDAMQVAHNDQAAANQVAYEAFEAATVDARDALNQAWTMEASESQWMQIYLDYMVATADAQAELNAATFVANEVFVEAKYAAIADFDAASFDAATDAGVAALAAIADYRGASKALELEQFAKNLSDSAELTGGIITRMQAFLDTLATLESEADINAARDAYYTDLGSFYYETSVASNDALKDFYDAVTVAEEAFVALTGESPSHPEYYPWWWYRGDDQIIVIDPVPGDCVEEPIVDECLPPVPGEPGDSVDPEPGDGSDEPEIAICPPYPGEFEYPHPVPPEWENSDSSDNDDESVDDAQTGDPVEPIDGPIDPEDLTPVSE